MVPMMAGTAMTTSMGRDVLGASGAAATATETVAGTAAPALADTPSSAHSSSLSLMTARLLVLALHAVITPRVMSSSRGPCALLAVLAGAFLAAGTFLGGAFRAAGLVGAFPPLPAGGHAP